MAGGQYVVHHFLGSGPVVNAGIGDQVLVFRIFAALYKGEGMVQAVKVSLVYRI